MGQYGTQFYYTLGELGTPTPGSAKVIGRQPKSCLDQVFYLLKFAPTLILSVNGKCLKMVRMRGNQLTGGSMGLRNVLQLILHEKSQNCL